MKKSKLQVLAITCYSCLDTVFSRAGHDFRRCSCNSVAIDGGFTGYTRTIGDPGSFKYETIEIEQTRAELYDDYNKRIDKFGIIKDDDCDGNSKSKKPRRNKAVSGIS